MYQKLNELCHKRKIPISKLCEQVTNSPGNLATWKKGYMRSDYLAKCCEILNVSADYLLDVHVSRPVSSPVASPALAEMLDIFPQLSDSAQEMLLDVARAALAREQKNAVLG